MIISNITREQLILIGKQIVNPQGLSEEEHIKLCYEFNKNFSHPDTANLFFYPENSNTRKIKTSNYNPTVEEVVDIGIAHKPILH